LLAAGTLGSVSASQARANAGQDVVYMYNNSHAPHLMYMRWVVQL